jgi:tRNA A-37 threonylcarbamoyl transferase component Bud32
MEKIIAQGAEAILIQKETSVPQASGASFDKSRAEGAKRLSASNSARISSESILIKRRIKKSYRLPELDEKLRKLRTRSEAKLLEKAAKIIPTPRIIKVSENSKEIEMEFLEGKKLSENLDEIQNWKEVCQEIGQNIAKLHDLDIIHGDLTTSNMILIEEANTRTQRNAKRFDISSNRRSEATINEQLRPHQEYLKGSTSNSPRLKVYFIDYGLGFANGKIEDKAVDLHLIKQALEAKHFQNYEKFWEAVLEGYKISKNHKETLRRLEKVEKRGRYKQQF